MYRKLRSPILGTEGILGIVAICSFLILMALSHQLGMIFGAAICFISFVVTLIVLLRTRNTFFIPQLLGQFLGTILLLMVAFMDVKENAAFFIPIAGLMGMSFTIMIIFAFQRKLKWRTRETLELAAQPLVDKTMEELSGFASFIRRNLIAIPVYDSKRIIFILNIPFERLLTFNNNYHDRTWVAFNHEGNVTVNISQQDYYMYRDQWAFDQLCISLGNLFIEFLEEYKKGAETLIIQRMNALNLNIITEG